MLKQSLKIHKSSPEDFGSNVLLRKLSFVSSVISSRQKTILDAGCGNGFAQRFYPESAMYIGIDFNEENLKALWHGQKSAPRIEGTITHLPIVDDFFDIILNLNVIEHIPKEFQEPMVTELFRVLKTCGHLILITDNIETIFNAELFLTPKHHHCLAYNELKHLLLGCGFTRIKRIYFDIVLDYPNRFVGILPFVVRNRLARLFPRLDKFIIVEAIKA